MAHKIYENFVLANEIEDQYNSHLDLIRFCTVDNSLVGTPGMKKKINVYSATNGTEKVAMGVGNSKDIEVTYSEVEYEILTAQNRFKYFDEQEMTDPLVVTTGLRHMATDMFNTVNADIYAEFAKATQEVTGATFAFGDFVDAAALLNSENVEGLELFAFVSPEDMATIRKNLKEDLKFVEAFSRTGYVGTVAGINLYTKKDATKGTIYGGTREAITLFNKKGTEVEQDRDSDIRENTIWSRKYYLAAMTDATKCFKIVRA
jgi:hypothetical protein